MKTRSEHADSVILGWLPAAAERRPARRQTRETPAGFAHVFQGSSNRTPWSER